MILLFIFITQHFNLGLKRESLKTQKLTFVGIICCFPAVTILMYVECLPLYYQSSLCEMAKAVYCMLNANYSNEDLIIGSLKVNPLWVSC